MGDDNRKHPGSRNRHGWAVDSHPHSTSSTLRAMLHVRVRGVGAFPANTEIACTIASLRGVCGIEQPGHEIAASVADAGGISCVEGCSCGHATTFFQIWTVGFSCLPCASCASVLCGRLGMHVFARAPYPCSLPCNTLGIFTPSEQVVFLVVPHCRTAHPSICRSRINNLPHIVCHQLLPSSHSLPVGQFHRGSSRSSHKKYPPKNGVSIGSMFPRSRHMGHVQPIPHVALVLAYHRIIPALVFDTPLWGVPIAPRRNHMSHMLWTVVRYHCNVTGTQWRHKFAQQCTWLLYITTQHIKHIPSIPSSDLCIRYWWCSYKMRHAQPKQTKPEPRICFISTWIFANSWKWRRFQHTSAWHSWLVQLFQYQPTYGICPRCHPRKWIWDLRSCSPFDVLAEAKPTRHTPQLWQPSSRSQMLPCAMCLCCMACPL